MKRQLKFGVGSWVRVAACLRFDYENFNFEKHGASKRRERTVEALPFKEPPAGQVTGAAFIPMGHRVLGDYDDPTTFEPEGSIFVYLIRLGATNTEMRVREADLEPCEPLPGGLPLRYAVFPPWSDAAREEVRQEAKRAKRDEKGRFK